MLVELFLGHSVERRESVNARVINQDIDPAESLLRGGEERFDFGFFGNVGLDGYGFSIALGDRINTRSAPSFEEL